MFRIILKNIAIAVGIGSFIYLINVLPILETSEVMSIWIVTGIIGLVSTLHYTEMSGRNAIIIQFVTGIVAFLVAAFFNGWIELTARDIIIYGFEIFVLMLIIYLIFYVMAALDSQKINKKLNE